MGRRGLVLKEEIIGELLIVTGDVGRQLLIPILHQFGGDLPLNFATEGSVLAVCATGGQEGGRVLGRVRRVTLLGECHLEVLLGWNLHSIDKI